MEVIVLFRFISVFVIRSIMFNGVKFVWKVVEVFISEV